MKYWEQVRNDFKNQPDIMVEKAISIVQSICSGLISLHKSNIVHRDIKPANIIIIDNSPVLIDFGLIFNPEEERLTTVDDAVGNAGYSPDQMMNKMENVPPWLDVFQLSQLLIWMVGEESVKPWTRPLDWRWVRYPNISKFNSLCIRALTAICSDPYRSPSDAEALNNLITELFMKVTPQDDSFSQSVSDVIESIKKGKAKSLIIGSNDQAAFNSTFPIFKITYLKIEEFMKELEHLGGNELPIKFVDYKYTIEEFGDFYSKVDKFDRPTSHEPFKVYCGEIYRAGIILSDNNFFISTGYQFFPPSLIKENNFKVPDGFLPFKITLGKGSAKKINRESLYLFIDDKGQLWFSNKYGDSDLILITFDELFNKIRNWVLDPEAWEIIYL